MKIMGIAVTQGDGGWNVGLQVFLRAGEAMEESDVQRIFDTARELVGNYSDTSAPADRGGDAGVARDPEISAQPDEPGKIVRRRRGAAPVTKPRQPEATTEETTQPAAGVRRRRGTVDPTPSQVSPAVETAAPSTGAAPVRRRRGPATPSSEPQPIQAPPPSSESSSRRRRGSPADAPPVASATAASPTKDISDEEVMKACSLTARKAGTEAVKDILTQFGVGSIDKLPKGDRKEFLALLAEARGA